MAKLTSGLIALLALPVLLGACAGTAPVAYTEVEGAGLLKSNQQDDGHVPLVYAAPGPSLAGYGGVIVDPVVVYEGPDQQFGRLPAADRAAVAADMHEAFAQAAAQRFRLADAPGPMCCGCG